MTFFSLLLCSQFLSFVFSVNLFVASNFQNWHPEWEDFVVPLLAKKCPIPCHITQPEVADAVVYHCGDKKAYTNWWNERRTKVKVVVCSVPHSIADLSFQAADILITYDPIETTQIMPVSFIPNVTEFLEQAKTSLKQKKTKLEVAFVAGRPAPMRDRLMMELKAEYPVISYGKHMNNKKWPRGHLLDKGYVMRIHKFCFAAEKYKDLGYITEVLWDCLRSASVPIYYGNPTLEHHNIFPPNSIINIKNFPDMKSVADHLWHLHENETAYEEYREWILHPNQEFIEFHAIRTQVSQVCRLCMKIQTRKLHL